VALAATLVLACPECGSFIDVPVYIDTDLDELGRQEWYTRIDDADLWAHSWSHDPELSDAGFVEDE
jgi:hypothetical protein